MPHQSRFILCWVISMRNGIAIFDPPCRKHLMISVYPRVGDDDHSPGTAEFVLNQLLQIGYLTAVTDGIEWSWRVLDQRKQSRQCAARNRSRRWALGWSWMNEWKLERDQPFLKLCWRDDARRSAPWLCREIHAFPSPPRRTAASRDAYVLPWRRQRFITD